MQAVHVAQPVTPRQSTSRLRFRTHPGTLFDFGSPRSPVRTGPGSCLFSKPIISELDVRMTYGSFTWSRVRTLSRCSLFVNPISSEQIVRMTYEGFTSPQQRFQRSASRVADPSSIPGRNLAKFLREPEFDSCVNDANFCFVT